MTRLVARQTETSMRSPWEKCAGVCVDVCVFIHEGTEWSAIWGLKLVYIQSKVDTLRRLQWIFGFTDTHIYPCITMIFSFFWQQDIFWTFRWLLHAMCPNVWVLSHSHPPQLRTPSLIFIIIYSALKVKLCRSCRGSVACGQTLSMCTSGYTLATESLKKWKK